MLIKLKIKLIVKSSNRTVAKTKNGLIGFVGHSGAGKSTITKLLLRCYEPDSGEIYIWNKNIKDISLNSFKQNISYVSQDIEFEHRITTIINCKTLFVFDNGVVTDYGTHEELIKRDGIYKDIFIENQEGKEKLDSNNNYCTI